MPYVPPKLRDGLRPSRDIDGDFFRVAENPGELNFQLSTLIDTYLLRGVSYQRLNDVVGVLECLKMEVYRRIAAPYEDGKIVTNGDVFKCLLPKDII